VWPFASPGYGFPRKLMMVVKMGYAKVSSCQNVNISTLEAFKEVGKGR
jgi:hypothetical protein